MSWYGPRTERTCPQTTTERMLTGHRRCTSTSSGQGGRQRPQRQPKGRRFRRLGFSTVRLAEVQEVGRFQAESVGPVAVLRTDHPGSIGPQQGIQPGQGFREAVWVTQRGLEQPELLLW